MPKDKIYCLDTNVYIEGWNKYYSIDFCHGYWEIVTSLAIENRVFSPYEVKREIDKIDDELKTWIKDKPFLFREIDDEVQMILRKILDQFPRLVDSTKQRSIADPWVIAHAIKENATVVTKEATVGMNSRRIKIPDVCKQLNIPWIDDFQFGREIGIVFNASINPP